MVKFFDTILGKTKPIKANLDQLFALPSAAITLEVSANLKSTGRAAVCFKPASGSAFANTSVEFEEILKTLHKDDADPNATHVTQETDSFGYRWVVLSDDGLEELVTETHMINRSLEDHGFSPQLLCSVFSFVDTTDQTKVYWIYLYKQGTFYPFVPQANERRDNERELSLKSVVGQDLPVEPDLSRWFPIWEIPV
ncbi:MAG: hypothetical protein HKL82_12615 [Acidimicrobiaceae bacterium]|nr:hypothetical protein [Acidimicrobiaceae bacterium]